MRVGSAEDCSGTPVRSRSSRVWRCGSRPSTDIAPPSWRRRPSMHSISVVLPAPLGPIIPKTSPGRTAKETPRSTWWSPYALTTSWHTTTSLTLVLRVGVGPRRARGRVLLELLEELGAALQVAHQQVELGEGEPLLGAAEHEELVAGFDAEVAPRLGGDGDLAAFADGHGADEAAAAGAVGGGLVLGAHAITSPHGARCACHDM